VVGGADLPEFHLHDYEAIAEQQVPVLPVDKGHVCQLPHSVGSLEGCRAIFGWVNLLRGRLSLLTEGDATMEIWKGKAKRIEDIDLPRVGHMIGVGEDEVHAILDVESAGSGFDSKGRVKMLFEPHVFWRLLGKGPKRDAAAKQGLAYPNWRRDYPKDSFPRLIAAMKIDPEIALRSASWGLGQIMGFNHAAAGFLSAAAMVKAFADDEDQHLEAMIRFIKANKLDDELRRHDWAGFARGYNGPGFAKNGYDKKIKAAFDRWQKIRDTEWSPAPAISPVRTAEAIPVGPDEAAGRAGGFGALIALITGLLAAGLGAFWDRVVALFGG
jgi:hypothetical protein